MDWLFVREGVLICGDAALVALCRRAASDGSQSGGHPSFIPNSSHLSSAARKSKENVLLCKNLCSIPDLRVVTL